MPGSPPDPRSEGTNGLLKQGATPVTEAADVIAAIEPILGRSIERPSAQEASQETRGSCGDGAHTDERSRLLALLGPAPVSIDDLVRLSRPQPACAACCWNWKSADASRDTARGWYRFCNVP